MEFNEKLQELRRAKDLTQEELAEILYVSRTAVSKWESGRGYPNIDSLKAIAKFFGVTIDELLSNNELLTIAEEDTKQKEKYYRRLIFGLLDICVTILLFLPFFGQRSNGIAQVSSLLYLTDISLYLKIAYYFIVFAIITNGLLTFVLKSRTEIFCMKASLALNSLGVVLFVVSLQPYAAVFLLMMLAIKVLMLIKWQ